MGRLHPHELLDQRDRLFARFDRLALLALGAGRVRQAIQADREQLLPPGVLRIFGHQLPAQGQGLAARLGPPCTRIRSPLSHSASSR
ncbi:MAG TPA: hypothetical protein ENK18_02630 [Deltaproteobacteria bacterium]|nr:hypothetical protein [Deltaproteobacteria bacterium]